MYAIFFESQLYFRCWLPLSGSYWGYPVSNTGNHWLIQFSTLLQIQKHLFNYILDKLSRQTDWITSNIILNCSLGFPLSLSSSPTFCFYLFFRSLTPLHCSVQFMSKFIMETFSHTYLKRALYSFSYTLCSWFEWRPLVLPPEATEFKHRFN